MAPTGPEAFLEIVAEGGESSVPLFTYVPAAASCLPPHKSFGDGAMTILLQTKAAIEYCLWKTSETV